MKNIKKRIYRVFIDKNYCKNCLICLNVCPKKVFDLDENYEVVVKNVDECIGCRLCENLCPDFAIEVEEL